MSSLKLLHSGGNGVIISAPSSNPAANRTITLNDNYGGDGSFVTANSSGNVGIGTASPSEKLDVEGTIECLNELRSKTGNDLKLNAGSANRDIFLQVNDSTLMTVKGSGGNLLVGRTNTINVDGETCNHVFEQLGSSNFALGIHCNQSTKKGLGIYYTSGGTGSDFLFCEEAGTAKFIMKGNGGFANYQSNDVNLSDISMKKNITDASSTINEVKQWKIREFHLTDEEDSADKRFGVIAQEIETIDSKVVTDYSTNLKGVKEQQIYWKAIKSLQEAIAKIEVLETEKTQMQTDLTALTARVAALEAG